MNEPGSHVECATFAEQVGELVLGDVPEPQRGGLLAHAAQCASCRAALDDLMVLADRLLVVAPEHEPAPGFEQRVLARAHGAARRRPARPWLAAAAAVLLLVGGLAAGVVWGRSSSGESAALASPIVNASGERVGDVLLVDGDHPYALVTIDRPSPGRGEVWCEFEMADGRRVRVGTWGYDDVQANVWAVGVPAEVLAAVRMHVVADDGTVLATAALG